MSPPPLAPCPRYTRAGWALGSACAPAKHRAESWRGSALPAGGVSLRQAGFGVPRCRRLPPPAKHHLCCSRSPRHHPNLLPPPCPPSPGLVARPPQHPQHPQHAPPARPPHSCLLSPLPGVFFSCWQPSFPRRLLRKSLPWAMGRPRRRTSPQVRAAGSGARAALVLPRLSRGSRHLSFLFFLLPRHPSPEEKTCG